MSAGLQLETGHSENLDFTRLFVVFGVNRRRKSFCHGLQSTDGSHTGNRTLRELGLYMLPLFPCSPDEIEHVPLFPKTPAIHSVSVMSTKSLSFKC